MPPHWIGYMHGKRSFTMKSRYTYIASEASELVRKTYDLKCKHLRHVEWKRERSEQIDRTRAVVKDLYSRIKVAIHIIDSISKRIEEIRDRELQHRQITINLETELNSLSSSFSKWVNAQKSYLQAIYNWLEKCVLMLQKTSRRLAEGREGLRLLS
ncbi:hypothetical protein SAY86_008708 [Trapa natans]|uniref:DUF632 domain-containing protein n=1 Tax=Trapa natans TaxID=22666 RepID=A0AAN7KHL8_TRANT|nr:hypothetical protein SAY86_008708 [Trapa natans]